MFKKYFFSVLICFFTILLFQCLPSVEAKAATTAQVSYSLNGNTVVGNTFDININLSNATDLYGASVDFSYDPTLLQVTGISMGDIWTGSNASVIPVSSTSNIAKIAISSTGSTSGITKSSGKLAVIKVKALKEGSISLITSSDSSRFNINGCNLVVKLANSNIARIPYTPTPISIQITKLQGAATSPGRYEESTSSARYVGTWSDHTSSLVSGGKGKMSSTTGSYVEFKFLGTSIKWVSYLSKNRGIAKVYIDGVLDKTVNTSSTTDKPKAIVYEKSGLSYSGHIIKIEVTGTKSSTSSSPLIYVDAFDFAVDLNGAATTPGRYEESSAFTKYSGTWLDHYSSYVSGGKGKVSTVSGSYAEFKFTGTSISWISYFSKSRGIANVYIDGIFDKAVDTSNAYDKTQVVVYKKTGLSNTIHTIKVEVTGTKSSASTSPLIYIDAFDFSTNPLSYATTSGRYEESSNFNSYVGVWNDHSSTLVSGGKGKMSSAAGSYAEFRFTGTSIKWVSYLSKNRGIANVYIDGVLDKNVDTSAATDKAQAIVYSKIGLTNTTHTIRIRVSGNKSAASNSPLIYVDAFDFTK